MPWHIFEVILPTWSTSTEIAARCVDVRIYVDMGVWGQIKHHDGPNLSQNYER